ncbi:hypothetical protein Pla175_08110 [Pirellulimonas nuda]|uniref:Uncharacterized protein n=1 Tax=Pirellulimonas nuda TaxID=2528009 RepID=A0A518D7M4_9BACT|nr:hypothetical protein [Pirellulimonas nuda]QDU87449.1 hypothetical protein Pla175_08110 [Pirellulimonas nuda]
MKFRFSIRMILIVIAFVAVLLMNVHERRQHAAEMADAQRLVRQTEANLAAMGFEGANAPFGPNEFRLVIVDIYGKGRSAVRDNSVVAQRVIIVTHAPEAVKTQSPDPSSYQIDVKCATQPQGGAADSSCTVSVYANVLSSLASDSSPTLIFNIGMFGEFASGHGTKVSVDQRATLEDHFRFDLESGVYPLGEPIDFYAFGENRQRDLKLVQLVVGAPPKPSAGAGSVSARSAEGDATQSSGR